MNIIFWEREKYYVYLLSSIHLSICFSLFLYLYWFIYHVYPGGTASEIVLPQKNIHLEKLYINGHDIAVCQYVHPIVIWGHAYFE